MFNMGGGEILIILVVALLVLGPDKLPRVMRTVGKTLGELRKASTDFQRTINTELSVDENPEARSLKAGKTAPEPAPLAPVSDGAAQPSEEDQSLASVSSQSAAGQPGQPAQVVRRKSAVRAFPASPQRSGAKKALHRKKSSVPGNTADTVSEG